MNCHLFHLSESALAAFEAAGTVSPTVPAKARRADTISAFVAYEPFPIGREFFPATLTGN